MHVNLLLSQIAIESILINVVYYTCNRGVLSNGKIPHIGVTLYIKKIKKKKKEKEKKGFYKLNHDA